MPCTQYLKNQKFRWANRLNWLKDLETILINRTEAHVPTPRYMRTTISPRQWRPWTAVSPLFRLMAVRMGKVLAIPQSWFVCFNAVNWYCFKFIWAHRSIFLIPSPYACRGRTVLQFPTNNYHLFTVELTIKVLLASYLPLMDPTAMPGWWSPTRANQSYPWLPLLGWNGCAHA